MNDLPSEREQPMQSLRFMWLYALAVAGGSIAYVPFLTILLPVRVAEIGDGETIEWLASIAFAGAIAASLSNVGFGWLSDLTKTRRVWIVAGLVLSSGLLVAMPLAQSPATLLVMIVLWQFGLNLMLSPLAAWGGDCVPDAQKGRLGGLLAIAPAFGALAGAFVTLPGLAESGTRPAIVAALVIMCVLPAVIFGAPNAMPQLMDDRLHAEKAHQVDRGSRPVPRMWLARLLVQIAEAALFAFLLIWLMSLDSSFSDNDTAIVFAIVIAVSVPLALAAGTWSDRSGRPILPLAVTAVCGAAGLAIMALAGSVTMGIAGYILFGLTTSVFLALHTAQTLRILPKPSTRGRDLGIFNLTNTLPSMIMPGLTLALVPSFGFAGLFILLAALCALAAVILLRLTVRS